MRQSAAGFLSAAVLLLLLAETSYAAVPVHAVDFSKLAPQLEDDDAAAEDLAFVGVGAHRLSHGGEVFLPRRNIGHSMAEAILAKYPGVKYFRKRWSGKGYVGLGTGVFVRRNHKAGRRLCYVKDGAKERLATRRPCYRLSRSQGRLVAVSKRFTDKGIRTMIGPNGYGKPDDPRKEWRKGKWRTKTTLSAATLNRFRFRNNMWFSGPGYKRVFVDFRWWPADRVNRGFVNRLYRNNPYMRRRGGKWSAIRRRRSFIRRNGVWYRRKHSKRVYINGRWMSLRRAMRYDPNFSSRYGKIVYSNAGTSRYWQSPSGWWFLYRGSRHVFFRGHWTSVLSDRRWKRVCRRRNYCYYDNMDPNSFARRDALRYNRHARRWPLGFAQQEMRDGHLTPDLRSLIRNQVHQRFFRFMMWFITNYMRGGNYAHNRFLISRIHGLVDKFDVEPTPSKNEEEVGNPSVITHNVPAKLLVDGWTKQTARNRNRIIRKEHL
eukprot:comp9364_c0_seq1/m.10811 comp9364_c0_seq1/g.10811  ORF comp9364_c0_seq1/g.10811 comp9364_c0_seq1/m.10811 type:complete len:488 (+) comp9364_c0_seq1:175-1638(+)